MGSVAMEFKILALISVQLLIAINLTYGQIVPTLPPPVVPTFTTCPIQGLPANQRWVTYSYNGQASPYCYLYPTYQTYATTWHYANQYCQLKNATLFTARDYNTNYILSHPRSITSGYLDTYWIGLTSLNNRRGLYRWYDGSGLNFNNFANTTANGDRLPPDVKDQGRCVSLRVAYYGYRNYYRNIGSWFKEDCSMNRRYICQRKINGQAKPTPPPAPKGGCPPGWYNSNQKCIKYFPQPLTYAQAKTKCQQQTNGQNNGELLTIHSQIEQDFLIALAGTGIKDSYLGLTKTAINSAWKWADQSQSDYYNFGVQTQTGYRQTKFCAIMVTNSSQPGRWLPVYCSDAHPFMCEVFKDPGANQGIDFLGKKCNVTSFGNAIQYKQSCYLMVNNPSTKLTYLDAENHCKSVGTGGHLLSINDIYEQSFLNYYTQIKGQHTDQYLLGLQSKGQSDTNDTQYFEWSDGWPVYYTDWMFREPKLLNKTQDQCVLYTNNIPTYMYGLGTWKTASCSIPFSYICKVSKNKVPTVNGATNGVCPKLVASADQKMQWVNLHKGTPYCYWFSADRTGASGAQTWSDASFHCRRRNGTLASIHTKHEESLLIARSTRYGYFGGIWIGLSKNPAGELLWEDSSPVDYTHWDKYEKYKNNSDLNDDSGNVCVELSSDKDWKQVSCNTNRRYFVCQTPKLFASSASSSPESHGGRTAGIVIGVLLGICALVGVVIYMRRNNMHIPQMPSFENPLNRSQRGGTGIKPQEFHNNNPSPSDLTHSSSNESPFSKSLE